MGGGRGEDTSGKHMSSGTATAASVAVEEEDEPAERWLAAALTTAWRAVSRLAALSVAPPN